MKKLIILLIMFYSLINAQDKEPNPWNFTWGYSSTPRPFVLDSFPQNSFLTGFQWSGSTKMNNALGNNAMANNSYQTAQGTVNKPINLVIQPKWFDGSDYSPGYFGAVMMQYEPTLPINIFNQGKIIRLQDPTDPVFGFRNRKGTISNDPLASNYSRLILYKDSNYVDSTVLSDIWPQPRFNSHDWGERGGQTDNYLGKKWYLAINLKRLNPTTDLTKNNDIVLKITIPFKRWDDTLANIKFNKVPIKSSVTKEELLFMNPDSASQYPFIVSRGYAQLMHIDTTETIEITKNMIPTSSDPTENITIYAEFHTNDEINPKFKKDDDFLERIKDFDIEVEYKGGLDIAIDWIRVENFQGHKLNRGELDWIAPSNYNDVNGRGRRTYWPNDKDSTKVYIKVNGVITDSTMRKDSTEIVDIYNTIASSLKHIKSKSYNWQDAKLFRLYFQDIENSSFYWWGVLRYVNKLANGMFLASDGSNYPELYEYYTKCPNRYFGKKFSANEHYMANPFNRVRGSDVFSMGHKRGYYGEYYEDSLTSGYETYFKVRSHYSTIKNFDLTSYFNSLKDNNTIQGDWEFGNYFDPINHKFLYSNNSWYINFFIGTQVEYSSVASTMVDNPLNKAAAFKHIRPKTGEEIRLLFNYELILGTKGIFFDREESAPLLNYNINFIPYTKDYTGLGDGSKNAVYGDDENYYRYLRSDTLGGDFVGGIGDIYNFSAFVNKTQYSLQTQVDSNRIYTGVKSVRLEVKKLIDWIRLNDIELMDMRLQAIYSKGFKTFENWNPNKYSRWSNSPLRKLVDLNNIRTRKLFEPKHTLIHNTNPDYESKDSSFFDITLLQHKNNTDTDLFLNKNAVYLGVINRRTDPLIFRDSLQLDSLRELMFFTTTEFDDKVRHGGVDLWGINQDSTWWQQQWWKRLGAREIKIPLNIKPYGNGTYILAQEIGIDSLDQLGWRYDEKYYQKIDTTLRYSDSLKTKLLPGQGKIIKLEFVPYFFNDPTKDIDPTNDHCYFCDIYNDSEIFKFNVIKENEVEEGCCYTVTYTYTGDCDFEDIPLRLIIEGESGNTFVGSNPLNILKDSLNPNIKYKDFLLNLSSNANPVTLGTFCVSESSNNYKISLLAGKDKDDKFIGCDREMQFEVKCDENNEPPKDCCEGLSVSHSNYSTGVDPLDPYSGNYCTVLSVSTGFDSDCIFGISLLGDGLQRTLMPIGSNPIDFTTGLGKVFTICYKLKECGGSGSVPVFEKMVKMQFLGKNGTVICEFEVPIWVPCINAKLNELIIGDPLGGPVSPKNSNEKQDSKTYETETFKVTIWPNPTSGDLNVEIDSKVDTEVDINFISNIGASVTNDNGVTINKGVNEKTYNLKNYASGVYYLQINGKDGNIVLPIMLNK